ncbi:MAG: sulfatase-like hydrolase/transferase [Acidobacteria bacterium]|jgi:arylsulfatase A-like enzyme|nr:sulfatase-like hydrolase/transferase [Acidobacteriota bacterium]
MPSVFRAAPLAAALALSLGLPPPALPAPPPAPAPLAPPHLLVITLDTVRADRLGAYGHAAAATPRLDRLAREGALVEGAQAVAPLTLPAHASLFTGLYPPAHGVRDNADFVLPASVTTLAEVLAARGYRTAAVVGAAVLARTQGLDQGFASYDEPGMAPAEKPSAAAGKGAAGKSPASATLRPIVERRASEVTDRALAALDRLASSKPAGPFFLWVHYFDPHAEYAPPEPYRARFKSSPYDGEIAYVDAQLGRLLDALAAKGLAGRTLIAVVGDHGEGLGEHGESTHGVFLYETTLAVPLLLKLPGTIAAGVRVPGPVSQVDLAPTLLELLGAPPLPRAQGASFAASLGRGGSVAAGGRAPGAPAAGPATGSAPRPLYSETLYPERVYGWAPLFALRSGASKLIDAPRPELYDLSADPRERKDLAAAEPARLRERQAELARLREALGGADPAAESPSDAERRAQLEALGYAAGRGTGAARAGGAPPLDPKDGIRLEMAIEDGRQALVAGRPDDALARLAPVLNADPGNAAALSLSGVALFSTGRRDEGLARLARAVEIAGETFEYRVNYGAALYQARRAAPAVEQYRAALALQPESSEARYALAAALYAAGDREGALLETRALLAAQPGHAAGKKLQDRILAAP